MQCFKSIYRAKDGERMREGCITAVVEMRLEISKMIKISNDSDL